MTPILKSKVRPKIKILESAYNEIINTVASRPAESGGLLFGNEDNMIIQKFVFDKNARTTRSTYSFDVGFLNPEIKRLWNEEKQSCIGFLHSHPQGYSWPSPPDMAYFAGMFESMPRKHYIVPIVHCVPDGGFKLNAYILPNGSEQAIKADVEILPDDYFQNNDIKNTEKKIPETFNSFTVMKQTNKFNMIVDAAWTIWKLILVFGATWFLFNALYILTNHMHKIWP